jgi:hypothetical protein
MTDQAATPTGAEGSARPQPAPAQAQEKPATVQDRLKASMFVEEPKQDEGRALPSDDKPRSTTGEFAKGEKPASAEEAQADPEVNDGQQAEAEVDPANSGQEGQEEQLTFSSTRC